MNKPSRRNLLKSAALSASLVAAKVHAQTPEVNRFEVDDQRPFREQTRRLKVTNRGRYVTSLIFAVDYPTHFRLKPELYPVLTPGGYPVTDSHQYCFIHHQSVMCGHGRVRTHDGRVIDFYRTLNFPESGRADKWHSLDRNLFHLGPSGIQELTKASWTAAENARIDLELTWRTRKHDADEGEPILREKRRYQIAQSGPHTIIDQYSELVPTQGTAVLEADRHSFCGVRVHDLIDVDEGGTMRDSEGRENPDGNYWDREGDRKAPRWIDCTGRIGNTTVGITLIGHPQNIRNQYYMQAWGLMEVSPVLGEDVKFSSANPFRFAARYVAHDGVMRPETANQLFTSFGRLPLHV